MIGQTNHQRINNMRLTAPGKILFIVSLVLAILALLNVLGIANISVGSFGAAEIALVAYAVLGFGVLFKGM